MDPIPAILLCLLFSFLLAAMEGGMLSINRIRLRQLLKLKDPAARRISRSLADPDRMIMTTLVLTNLFNIAALTLGVQLATAKFGNAGFPLVLMIALPVWILGLEMLPKSLSRRLSIRSIALLSYPLSLASTLFTPLHAVGRRFARLLFFNRPVERLRLFGGREDFKYLTFESEREGIITADQRKIINTVIDFRLLSAQDVLVPLEEAGAIRGDLPLSAARQLAKSKGVDRLPVLSPDGHVSGLLDLHELAIEGHWHGTAEIFQRRILRADASEPAPILMRKMRSARLPMAAVRDTNGTHIGVVLWEDLVRRLLLPASSEPSTNAQK